MLISPRDPPITVMQPTASHAGETMSAPPRASRVALWIFLASALICIFVYLAMTVQGPWFGSARTLHWTPGDLSVTGGSAQMRPDGLAVRASDAVHPVRIAINTSLRATDYPVIAWETLGVYCSAIANTAKTGRKIGGLGGRLSDEAQIWFNRLPTRRKFLLSFRVGHRTCTWTVPPIRPGGVLHMAVEWFPDTPRRLAPTFRARMTPCT